jgi:hypothetical protein
MDESPPLPPAPNGRQAGGRFAQGNSFGRGNPNLARVHLLRSRLLGSVTPENIEAVAKRLVGLAEGGDLDAIKVLLAYTVGRPPTTLELSGPDGEALGGFDWPKIQAAILGALARFPEARVEVAARLRGLVDDEDRASGAGDGVGPEPRAGGVGP